MKNISLLFLILLLNTSNVFSQQQTANYLYRCNQKLIDIVMEDLFTPPVASRVHVYPNIAAYEVLCKNNTLMKSMSGQLKGLEGIPDPTTKVDYFLSSCIAFTTVAKKLVYSECLVADFENAESELWLTTHKGDSALLASSIDYGRLVGQKIIVWLKKDNYDYSRTLSRYVLSDTLGAWQPTGPDYANAIEPNWPLIRSMVFDSTTTIKCLPNIPYSEKKNSVYYKNAYSLYEQSLKLDTEKKVIANFWDCNPNITKSAGHFTYFIHKISPAGHWISITGQAVKNIQLDEYKTARAYTMVTLGIFEGLKCCWTAKYNYNALRPETFINSLIAPTWKSFIETPPFPEYTSGHSVISSVAATILTSVIPQPYQFTDSTELYINLNPRHFNSFIEAAREASVSRFYGGIHFMPALDNGLVQGREIGEYILRNIKN